MGICSPLGDLSVDARRGSALHEDRKCGRYARRVTESLNAAELRFADYLDLHGFRGRGEEAAKVLLEEVITRQWQ